MIGDLVRDERNTLSNIDPYLQASWALAPTWKLDAGLRWSNVQFKSSDHFPADGNGSGSTGFHKLLPVVSLQHQLNEDSTLYASLGRGMETPTFNEISYRPGDLTGLNFSLKPAVSTSAELGIKRRFNMAGMRGDLSAALFQTQTDNEIVVASNQGNTSYQNAGRTRRRGLELSTTAWLHPQVRLNGSLTLLDARLRSAYGYLNSNGSTTTVPAGKRIAGTAKTWPIWDWTGFPPPTGAWVWIGAAWARSQPTMTTVSTRPATTWPASAWATPTAWGLEAQHFCPHRQPDRQKLCRLRHRQREQQALLRSRTWASMDAGHQPWLPVLAGPAERPSGPWARFLHPAPSPVLCYSVSCIFPRLFDALKQAKSPRKTVYPVLQDCALHLLQSTAWQSIENALQNPPSSSITPTSPTPSASISPELNTKAIPIRHGSFNRKQITFNCLTNVDKTSLLQSQNSGN